MGGRTSFGFMLIFANVICFMTMQVAFFWFVASKGVEKAIEQKKGLFVTLAQQVPEIRKEFDLILNDEEKMQKMKKKADKSFKIREDTNKALLYEYISTPYFITCALFVFSFLLTIFWKKTWEKVDFALIMTVFLAFLTEVVFYFVVINEQQIIGDMTLFRTGLEIVNNSNVFRQENRNPYYYSSSTRYE